MWTLFGSLLVGPVLADGVHRAPIGYAVLSLTVARMAAVAVAPAGTGFRWQTVAPMGWFGPRGPASGVFLLSVLLHGPTAGPLGRACARRAAAFPDPAPEREAGPEPQTRRRHMTA